MAANKIAARLQQASFNLRQKQAATLNTEMPRKNIDGAGRANYMTLSAPPAGASSDGNPSLFDVDLGDWTPAPLTGYATSSVTNEDYETDE